MMTIKDKSLIDWPSVVAKAKKIVLSYETLVTLRQLYYQLISDGTLKSIEYHYKKLSERTAKARRQLVDPFPDLIDLRHSIYSLPSWDGPADFMGNVVPQFRRDRTEGQKFNIYLVVEKAGMMEQLKAWFGARGVKIIGLGGFASQTLAGKIKADVEADGRPAILVYAGDHDASGDEIYDDFVKRTHCWLQSPKIALSREQIQRYQLPLLDGKISDSRSKKFCARHGYAEGFPVQVELDALPPETLRDLYQEAINLFWDDEAYQTARAREEEERETLYRLAVTLLPDDDQEDDQEDDQGDDSA